MLVLVANGNGPRDSNIPQNDPFSFFAPAIQIGQDERSRLDAGVAIAKILPAHDHELAVFAAGSTKANADEFVTKVRNIAQLKKSSFVPEIGRFSRQPQLHDVAALTLDQVDLDAIKKCRPGECDLKLTAPEIDRFQHVIATNAQNWKDATEQEFRRLIIERVTAYLRRGQHGIPPYGNGDKTDLSSTFSGLLQHSPYVQGRALQLGHYFEQYPAIRNPGTETFLYWSKETLAPKPIISVTHVAITRGDPHAGAPEVLVMSKEVFATHYTNGALALTLLIRATDSSSKHYFVYVNRTWIDAVRALWRPIVEHRVKSEAAKVFAQARDRIESGSRTPGP
jgi:hypothetical protein